MAAKIKNLHLYGTPEELTLKKAEYDWAGRNATRYAEDGHLIVLALRPVKKTVKKSREKAVDENATAPQEGKPLTRKGNGHERVKNFTQ